MIKEKYKILYLINGLSSGGAEMMLFRLLERLDRDKYEPEVVALLSLPGPLKKRIEDLGISVRIIGIKSKTDFFSILRLYRMIKASKPDILHAQLFASEIIGRVFGRLAGVPVVISSIRSEHYEGKIRDLLIKWTEPFAMRTTIVSGVAANRFIGANVVPVNKLRVIYNGIDPDLFFNGVSKAEKAELRKQLSLPLDKFIILAVGSLRAAKGYKYLLEAIYRFKEHAADFQLVIAGSGELEDELKASVRGLGLADKVVFLGRFDDVPKLMALADTLVLTSLREGLPGVVLEAMASELPVVASAVGGTKELVEDGITGYLVPPKSINDIAVAMEKVYRLSDKERSTMGKIARRKVQEEFHIDTMVKNYENLYDECLQEIEKSKGCLICSKRI